LKLAKPNTRAVFTANASVAKGLIICLGQQNMARDTAGGATRKTRSNMQPCAGGPHHNHKQETRMTPKYWWWTGRINAKHWPVKPMAGIGFLRWCAFWFGWLCGTVAPISRS
jgi:hypothetical protein